MMGDAPLQFTEDEIFEAFGLTDAEREWIRADVDGYRAARDAADAERAAFIAALGL